MSVLGDSLDWALDRGVIGGYTSLGYRLRGLEGSSPDPHGRLAGARVLITGCNSGIGFAAAQRFAELGAELHMVARDRDRGERARAVISERTGNEKLHLHLCDLADLDSVRALGGELRAGLDSLDALVHNAGALLQRRSRSPQGHEMSLAVHVLGPTLLTHLLAPLLGEARRGAGRVIFVTSGGMYTERLDVEDLQLERRRYDGPAFYAHAKRAQVALGPELGRRLGHGVDVHAMHPGWARTPGVADSLPRFNRMLGPLLRSPEQGADTIIWLAASERPASEPGRLWMDRRPRPEHRLPWTEEKPGEAARLYTAVCELIDLTPLPPASAQETPRDRSRRGPTGAARALPSP